MNEVVSFVDFIQELKQEKERLLKGTSYRRETARLAYEIAVQVKSVKPFFEQRTARSTVEKLYPKMDPHRLEDVAKFLRVIANDLKLHATMSEDLKKKIATQSLDTQGT